MNELKYKDITEKIIGASFEVHKFLGNGFQEVIYQRALAYEMGQANLEFQREIEQNIHYRDLSEPIRHQKSRLCGGRKGTGGAKGYQAVRRCTFSTGFELPERIPNWKLACSSILEAKA